MKYLTQAVMIVATLSGGLAATAYPGIAQPYDNGVPGYMTWQPGWNRANFDRHHVILGVVEDFRPYRLTVSRPDGMTQVVDLKNGTVIYPTGSTPSIGERVALIGYYSNGTFVVNRVVLRS